MLEVLGFGALDVAVYELLLENGRLPLSVVLGDVDPGPRREALDRLVSGGLVRRSPGPDPEFVVAPPEGAIGMLITEQMSRLHAVRESAAGLAARVPRHIGAGDPTQLVEVASGEGFTAQMFLRIIRTAKHEVVVFDRPPYAAEAEAVMAEQALRLRSGDLTMRTVFDRSLLADPVHVDRILRGARAGEQARVASVPLKLAIIDREWGVLPLSDAGQAPDALVIVQRSVLLDSMLALFETVWSHAVEVRPVCGDLVAVGTGERELRQLVHLMASGLTDTAIARHLGISPRTLRRRIQDLMEHLRVDSRFLAGVRAAEKGWLRAGPPGDRP